MYICWILTQLLANYMSRLFMGILHPSSLLRYIVKSLHGSFSFWMSLMYGWEKLKTNSREFPHAFPSELDYEASSNTAFAAMNITKCSYVRHYTSNM